MINGIKAIEASGRGYTIVGKVADDENYSGVILAGKVSGINKISDLKGRNVALFDNNTIPGVMMPLYYLHQQGLDVKKDFNRIKVSSFESAILAAFVGKADAALCLKRSWEVYSKNNPEIAVKLEVKWQTPHLLNNAVLFRNNMDSSLQENLAKALFEMHITGDGRQALKNLEFSRFEKASYNTYKPMLDFKRNYDAALAQ